VTDPPAGGAERSRRGPVDRPGDARIPPDKQFFKIGEVAEIAGVETHVLRFWETEFRSLKPQKNKANRRLYGRADVALVLRIRDLLYERGHTIAGARRALRDPAAGVDGGSVDGGARVRGLKDAIRKEVEELLRLVSE
jgi:DNA-binding transcriptional MerR regulator